MDCSMRSISELNGVSGHEENVRNYIKGLICDMSDSLITDSMGNLIAYKQGRSSEKKVMIGTNIDEPGFIVSGVTDKGYVKFKTVGTVDIRSVISKRVLINDSVKGIIGMKAIHLQKKSERETVPDVSSLYIDIGHKKKSSALKAVKPGDYISFDTSYYETGANVMGKALTRAGIVSLINSMTVQPAYDTYYVFSVQSEIPCRVPGRGMKIAAHRIKPDYALIVNTVTADDTYKSEDSKCNLGGGAVIEFMDKTCIADTMFTAALINLAENKNIKMQKITASSQMSIAGSVQTAASAVVTGVIGVPCRYKNTPVNIINRTDLEGVTALCTEFVKESDVITNGIA